MTANVKYTVEQRRLLQNSHCLSAASDSLYLQFKPIIWAQSYLRKHTNCTTPLQERYFPIPLLNTKIEKSYNFKIFLNVFENDNEKLEVLNSFLKLNFNRKSAAPERFRPGPVAPSHPPLLRHWVEVTHLSTVA